MVDVCSSHKGGQVSWEIFPGFSRDSWLSPCPSPGSGHPSGRSKFGGLPGAWARLVAALLLLAVGFSLAARQLYASGDGTGSQGSAAPRPGGHSHHPGVYHHGAIISPAGQSRELLRGGGARGWGPRPLPKTVSSLPQPRAPTWAGSCSSPGATSWTWELEQLCVWRWSTLTLQGSVSARDPTPALGPGTQA